MRHGFVGAIVALAYVAFACSAAAQRHSIPPPFEDLQACLEFADDTEGDRDQSSTATSILCREILHLWKDRSEARLKNSLRPFAPKSEREKLDLQPISAAIISKLLAIPDLLPPTITNGIVFERLTILGTLDLRGASIAMPVTFRNVTFQPESLRRHGDHFATVALNLERSRFQGSFTIEDSTALGNVLIAGTNFHSGLELRNVVVTLRGGDQTDETAASLRHLPFAPAFEIRHSTLEGGLQLADVTIFGNATPLLQFEDVTVDNLLMNGLYAEGYTNLSNNSIDLAEVQRSAFGSNFILENNKIQALKLDDVKFYDTPYLNYNDIESVMQLTGLSASLDGGDGNPEVAGNRVGGSAYIAIDYLTVDNVHGGGGEDAKGGEKPNTKYLDMTYNEFQSSVVLIPPEPVRVNASHTTVVDRLSLGRSLQIDPSRPLYEALDLGKGQLATFEDDQWVNLTNATVRILAWNFPVDCRIRWDGTGLQFEYWGDPDLKVANLRTEEQFLAALMHWRNCMSQWNAEALNYMSEYFDSRGHFSEARALLKEAKEANYRPEQPFLASMRAIWSWPAYLLVAPAGLGSKAGEPVPGSLRTFGAWLVYGLLAPTGFGAQPELALLWLLVGWMVGWGVYSLYLGYWSSPRWTPGWEASQDAPAARVFFAVAERVAAAPGFREIPAAAPEEALRRPQEGPGGLQETKGTYRMSDPMYEQWSSGPVTAWKISEEEGADKFIGKVQEAKANKSRWNPIYWEAIGPDEKRSIMPGFLQYDRDRKPAHFNVWTFSADAMLPVINLHAYSEYYPSNKAVRLFSFFQHIVGWWMLSVFLASATIL